VQYNCNTRKKFLYWSCIVVVLHLCGSLKRCTFEVNDDFFSFMSLRALVAMRVTSINSHNPKHNAVKYLGDEDRQGSNIHRSKSKSTLRKKISRNWHYDKNIFGGAENARNDKAKKENSRTPKVTLLLISVVTVTTDFNISTNCAFRCKITAYMLTFIN